MSDLRFDNPKTTEQYAAVLAELGHPAPWSFDPAEAGSVVDANGREVLVIDHNNERPDIEAVQIAAWIVCAVNTCAGFQALRESDGWVKAG